MTRLNILSVVTVLLLCIATISCKQEKATTVNLKGELKNFSGKVEMSKGTPDGYLLKQSVMIELNDSNRFDISFELKEPSYFRLGRNTLYLSPGDDVQLFCDLNDPNAANFTGTGAEASMYLRSKPFPKGGSYMTKEILAAVNDFGKVLTLLDEIVAKRLAELESLTSVTERFKKLEKGRVIFDAANALQSYASYVTYYQRMNEEETKEFSANAEKFFEAKTKEYLALGGDAEYLNLDTYRGLCDVCVKVLGENNVDSDIIDFMKTNELLYGLSTRGPIASVIAQRDSVAEIVVNPVYKGVIAEAFKKYDSLLPGKPAPELKLTNTNDEEILLSSLKGKTVIIDVWATWCGPCTAESPYFEKLAEKYAGDDMVFMSISIDSNTTIWKNYLKDHAKVSAQYYCARAGFAEYELFSVPRFIFIDKQGNFIEAFATYPSDPKFEELIITNK